MYIDIYRCLEFDDKCVDKRGECECFVNNVNYEYFIEHYSQFEFSSSETTVVAEGGAGRGAVSWLQVDHCRPSPLSSPPFCGYI